VRLVKTIWRRTEARAEKAFEVSSHAPATFVRKLAAQRLSTYSRDVTDPRDQLQASLGSAYTIELDKYLGPAR